MRRRLLYALAVVTPLGFATKLAPALDAAWIRFYAGGVLYVVFWVLCVLVVWPRLSPLRVAVAVLGVTSVIEVAQLVSHPLLEAVRATFLGRTLIGSTFSWWDFPCYLLGCVLAIVLVRLLGGKETDGSPPGHPRERSYPTRGVPGG